MEKSLFFRGGAGRVPVLLEHFSGVLFQIAVRREPAQERNADIFSEDRAGARLTQWNRNTHLFHTAASWYRWRSISASLAL
jgi:hypothetical protein